MATAEQSNTETLFHHWRKGDAEAGKVMAQRFTDWYYAIAVARLGEQEADEPFRTACSKFSKGVVKVTDPRRLLGWAHNIARKQLHTRSETGWISAGDLPNAFTREKSPRELLVRARAKLPRQVRLLEQTYRHGATSENPYEVLQARYELKAWLRDQADAPFRVVPLSPDRDLTPLPFYEAGRLNRDTEEIHFELYMLNERDVCQDVAEFAHFALALRAGLPADASEPKPAPPAPPAHPAPSPASKAAPLLPSTPAPASAPATASPPPAAPPAVSPTPSATQPRPAQPPPSEVQPSNTPFVVVLIIGLVLLFATLWGIANYYAE
jgi:hypothetical protein